MIGRSRHRVVIKVFIRVQMGYRGRFRVYPEYVAISIAAKSFAAAFFTESIRFIKAFPGISETITTNSSLPIL